MASRPWRRTAASCRDARRWPAPAGRRALRPAHHVEMAVGDRIERPGVKRDPRHGGGSNPPFPSRQGRSARRTTTKNPTLSDPERAIGAQAPSRLAEASTGAMNPNRGSNDKRVRGRLTGQGQGRVMLSKAYKSISAIALAGLIAGAWIVLPVASDTVVASAPLNSGKGDRLEYPADRHPVFAAGLALFRSRLPARPPRGQGQAKRARVVTADRISARYADYFASCWRVCLFILSASGCRIPHGSGCMMRKYVAAGRRRIAEPGHARQECPTGTPPGRPDARALADGDVVRHPDLTAQHHRSRRA